MFAFGPLGPGWFADAEWTRQRSCTVNQSSAGLAGRSSPFLTAHPGKASPAWTVYARPWLLGLRQRVFDNPARQSSSPEWSPRAQDLPNAGLRSLRWP